jgi:hypothetical protein
VIPNVSMDKVYSKFNSKSGQIHMRQVVVSLLKRVGHILVAVVQCRGGLDDLNKARIIWVARYINTVSKRANLNLIIWAFRWSGYVIEIELRLLMRHLYALPQ